MRDLVLIMALFSSASRINYRPEAELQVQSINGIILGQMKIRIDGIASQNEFINSEFRERYKF